MQRRKDQPQDQQEEQGKKFFPILRLGRFRFVLGPGTLLALVAGIIVLVYYNRPIPKPPPLIEHQVSSLSPKGEGFLVPEISWILQHPKELHLTPKQKQNLEALAQEWVIATKNQRENLQQASAEFEAFMKEQKGRRIPLSEIRKRAESLSLLSADLSAERRRYWAKAKTFLTSQQISRIKELLRPPLAKPSESEVQNPRSIPKSLGKE